MAYWSVAATLMLWPLVAMQFTDEVAWDLADFVLAGALFGGVGLAYELAVRKTASAAYRAAVGVALAAALILVWANLAVGIMGDEGNPANLMYFGVLAVGLVSALLARFRPRGMVYALIATAVAQTLVAVVAWSAGLGFTGPMTVFFAALWLFSASLFRKAARANGQHAQLPTPERPLS
jgi:hypothetical protein